MPDKASTVGELRESGYKPLTVREEIRNNLISKIQAGEDLFPGIIGFSDTVIPQLENAILAGQDIILLGERGQAKSRLIRHMVSLLDEEIPVIANCELNCDPLDPICYECKQMIARDGDAAKVSWLHRDERYSEKLATPDITVADLIGEVDPIKVAEGRYLSDELTIHYGLIPRTNRGIFCINELPDLSERIQVSLFNLMQERDIQIKGYRIMLPLDVFLVSTANPEDYTNRGRIITPLKDRYGAQIRTHYPRSLDDEIGIVEQEYAHFDDTDSRVSVPQYMREIIAEFTTLARRSPDINQRSGVSLRVSIANYETMLSAAFKRSLRHNELASPRVSDLPALVASTTGKIEMESVEEGREFRVIEDLVKKAVLNTFGRYYQPRQFADLTDLFEEGLTIECGSDKSSMDYLHGYAGMGEAADLIKDIEQSEEASAIASAVEFILEGLHLNRRLNCDRVGGQYIYSG
ncbi:MAG: magnesium chelatase [Chloroflexi bacterium]|nr:magnesium chelatase [Chloroflexota bacterium]